MATQIASTPTVKGKIAKEIFRQANQERVEASKEGAEKLKEKFSDKFQKTIYK